jgi:hypothetical protein
MVFQANTPLGRRIVFLSGVVRKCGLAPSRGSDALLMIVVGFVTLLNQVREKPALPKVSSCRDCLAPCAHRHGAKRAMRLR